LGPLYFGKFPNLEGAGRVAVARKKLLDECLMKVRGGDVNAGYASAKIIDGGIR
jgi:hypothetical protein